MVKEAQNAIYILLQIIGNLTIIAMVVLAIFAAFYGLFWLAKTFSYQIFYDDMVRETIRELVKPEYLNK